MYFGKEDVFKDLSPYKTEYLATVRSWLQRCVCLFVRAVLISPSVLRAQGRESSCKSVTAGAIGALFECRPGHHLSCLPAVCHAVFSPSRWIPGQHLKLVHACSCSQCYQFVTAIPSCHAALSGVTGPLNELQITDQESCIVQIDVTYVLVVICVRSDVWACMR
jgi:hypothetical protein